MVKLALPVKGNIRFFVFVLMTILASDLAGESNRNMQHRRENVSTSLSAALPSEQSHTGPLLHSIEVPSHKRIEHYIEFYSQDAGRAYLERCLSRMHPYEGFIRERIAAEGLPFELLYLPIVESAYQVNAVSRTGATGLWQFMANSVTGGGVSESTMVINQWIDERRDFWKSTEGSLKKLKYNYDQTGDWLLALAAYNCGLNRIERIIERTGIRDFFVLSDGGYLPRETVNYVPRFLAIAHLCAYSGRNGFTVNWERQDPWVRIPVDKSVDLKVIAKYSGVPLRDLTEANAELRYGITPPDVSPYFIKVRAPEAQAVEATLKRTDIQFLTYHIYTIASGDTLSELARHYGVTVAMIESYNRGIKANALKIGTKIIIPAIKDVPQYKGSKAPQVRSNFSEIQVVKQGDTLWSIAKSRNTTPEELASQNGISVTGILKPGQPLRVPPSR